MLVGDDVVLVFGVERLEVGGYEDLIGEEGGSVEFLQQVGVVRGVEVEEVVRGVFALLWAWSELELSDSRMLMFAHHICGLHDFRFQ